MGRRGLAETWTQGTPTGHDDAIFEEKQRRFSFGGYVGQLMDSLTLAAGPTRPTAARRAMLGFELRRTRHDKFPWTSTIVEIAFC